jgi:ketosteroid isomerase-like protein
MSAREKKMRALVSLVALLGLLSSANAGPKEDALAVLDKWTKAFAASDVDGIVKLYAPDALFVGTAVRRWSSSQRAFAVTSRMHCSPTGPAARPSMIMRR